MTKPINRIMPIARRTGWVNGRGRASERALAAGASTPARPPGA